VNNPLLKPMSEAKILELRDKIIAEPEFQAIKSPWNQMEYMWLRLWGNSKEASCPKKK